MDRKPLESLDWEVVLQAKLALSDEVGRLTKINAEHVAFASQQARTIADQAVLIADLARRIAELEARQNKPPKTPNNSSLPPSKGQKPSEPSGPKPKSRVHPGAHRPLHPDPNKIRKIFAGVCWCGCVVPEASQSACESYDHIDIPVVTPEVTRVILHGGLCPGCGGTLKAPAPEDMPPGSPFGANIRAAALLLRSVNGIPLERLCFVMRALFGLDISEGALVNMLKASARLFEAGAQAIRERLLSGTVIASDETTMRVGKVNFWLWVFHHADSALFVIANSRAATVIEEALGQFRPNYWLSDRYAAQLNRQAGEHQVCLAHLIRDAQHVIDSGDAILAPAFQELLELACRIGRRRPDLTDGTLKQYQRDLEKRLDAIMRLEPTHAAGKKFKDCIKKFRRHLFVFVTVRDLEPTNNGSERSLRPATVYRKVTNGFRSTWAAEHYADVRSVIETARRRAIAPFEAIKMTLRGQLLPTVA